MNRCWYKNLIYYIVLLCALPAIRAEDANYDTSFSLDFDPENIDPSKLPPRECSPQAVLNPLIEVAHAQIILQQNLYRRTNPINTRPIHEFPDFYLKPCCLASDAWHVMIEGFVHMTWRANFTKDSQFILSYIALDDPNLVQQFDDLDPSLKIPDILPLFAEAKLQERRGGIMFGGERTWDRWNLVIKTPIIYLERNFFLTQAERDAIDDAGLYALEDATVDVEAEQLKFARKHLISDKLGLGDTDILFGYNVIDELCMQLAVGGNIVLPTAFAFKKGLYGTHFPVNAKTPNFSIYDNLCLVFSPDPNLPLAKKNATDFLFQAVDRLSTILLEQKLGSGHVGVGAYTRSELCVNDHLVFKLFSQLKYDMPANESRFYIMQKNQAEFIDRDYEDPALANANLAFLNAELIDTLFPQRYETMVLPGFNFQLGTWLDARVKSIAFTLGYDLWWKQKESFGHIHAEDSVKNLLRTKIAKKPGACQQKLFAGINYMHKREDHEWCLGLFGDLTFLQFGLGNDCSIVLRYEMSV